MSDKRMVNDYIQVVSKGDRKLYISIVLTVVIIGGELFFIPILAKYTVNSIIFFLYIVQMIVSVVVCLGIIDKIDRGNVKRTINNQKNYNLLPGDDKMSDESRLAMLKEAAEKSFKIVSKIFKTSSITISDKYVSGTAYNSITIQPFIIPVEKIECVNYRYQPSMIFPKSTEEMFIELYLKNGYYITMFVKEVTINDREDKKKIDDILNVRILGD